MYKKGAEKLQLHLYKANDIHNILAFDGSIHNVFLGPRVIGRYNYLQQTLQSLDCFYLTTIRRVLIRQNTDKLRQPFYTKTVE